MSRQWIGEHTDNRKGDGDMAMRLVRVNQVYFTYPVSLSLNDDAFLAALLEKSKQVARVALYSVDKQGEDYIFSCEKHSV